MKKLTGVAKYAALCRGMLNRRVFRIPPRFIVAMLRIMRHEKLTRVGGRYHVNTHYAPFPSPAYNASLDLFARMKRRDFAPLSAYFSLTDRCVNRCAYCSNYKTSAGRDLPAAVLIDAIAQVQALGAVTIGFTGGEPLLRRDLEEIVAAVQPRSYTVLFTSGAGLTADRAARLAAAGLTVASVSIDSHLPDEQNRRRGSRRAFDDALAAIAAFSAAGVYTTASAVMNTGMESWKRMEDFADFLYARGAQELRILRETPWGRSKERPGAFDAARVEGLRESYNRDPRKITVMSLPGFESPEYCGCGAGIFHLYVDAEGTVCPCDFVQEGFGNIRTESLHAIYTRMTQSFRSNATECLSRRRRAGKALTTDEGFTGLLASLVDKGKSIKPEPLSVHRSPSPPTPLPKGEGRFAVPPSPFGRRGSGG